MRWKRSARKKALVDGFGQGTIRRANQTKINGAGNGRAKSENAPILEHPREFRLQSQFKFAHFVEKKGSPIRVLEKTFSVLGAGIKTPNGSEKDAFRERCGYAANILNDTGSGRERRIFMNHPGYKILAGTGLAVNHHILATIPKSNDRLTEFNHPRALSEQTIRKIRSSLTGDRAFRIPDKSAAIPFDAINQGRGIARQRKVAAHAGLYRKFVKRVRVRATHDNHGRMPRDTGHLKKKFGGATAFMSISKRTRSYVRAVSITGAFRRSRTVETSQISATDRINS